MTRVTYYALRSAARLAERRWDLYDEQIDGLPFTAERSQQLNARRAALTAAKARVPGGLTRPVLCWGTSLLPEWAARRNAVREVIRQRHFAARLTERRAA